MNGHAVHDTVRSGVVKANCRCLPFSLSSHLCDFLHQFQVGFAFLTASRDSDAFLAHSGSRFLMNSDSLSFAIVMILTNIFFSFSRMTRGAFSLRSLPIRPRDMSMRRPKTSSGWSSTQRAIFSSSAI